MEMWLSFIFFLFLWLWSRSKNSPTTNWPVLGMLPGLLLNFSHFHEYVTKILKENGGTFLFKGPWFANLDFVLTSDPMNTHHILSTNFANYPKGPDFKKIFDSLGDGILGTDDPESWKFQRRMTHWFLKNSKFQLYLERTIQEKVVKSLFPVLGHVSKQEMEVDLQDVFQRLYFDTTCLLILGRDPNCLSIEFPKVSFEKAFNEVEEALLYRHVVPESYWKLQQWLQIGEEKKLSRACQTLDSFIYKSISLKQEKHLQRRTQLMEEDQLQEDTDFDFLTAYFMEEETLKEWDSGDVTKSDKFLRDVVNSLMVAGRDTTTSAISWFFWLIATNQSVESKILEEMEEHLLEKDGKRSLFSAEELNKLVYLHAALCETLRLYPSVPINHKAALQPDTLPSGHHIDANRKVFLSFYSMGRMEQLWGKDCLEFKPERWISERGEIVHVPSYKFTAFNAGPRSCLGKDMSLTQTKIVAAFILLNYHVSVVEGQCVSSSNSVALHMKYGLKVRVTKRCL